MVKFLDTQTFEIMVMLSNELRFGVFCWDETDEIGEMILGSLTDLGFTSIKCITETLINENLDVIIVYGPFGSLVPIANNVLAIPPADRPILVLWMTEQFANPKIPEWIRYSTSAIRSRLERWAFYEEEKRTWVQKPNLFWVTERFHRYRYYGDLYWLQKEGLLSILAIASPWTANFLQKRGFDPILAYPGLCQECGEDLHSERDIPVLWLGKTGSNRRKRILNFIRDELRKHDIEIMVVDGIENPYVFGEDRTVLLNRSKIVLNILRQEWDDNSLRYCFAALNHSLVISEPTLRHSPFMPGEHIVELPIEEITDGIRYYLSHDEERQQITNRAFHLATSQMTMNRGVKNILEQIDVLMMDSKDRSSEFSPSLVSIDG